jgi:hypothetical protein
VGLVAGPADGLRLAPTEVRSVFLTPIDRLLDPAVYRSETRSWNGAEHLIHFYTVGEDVIWGLTAMILHQFLALWRQA